MNYRLGGGGFASDLTQVLREGKGYTYGVGSSFQGGHYPGPFSIGTSVRSNVTLESMEIIRDMLETYGPTFDEEDLAATQGFLLALQCPRLRDAGRQARGGARRERLRLCTRLRAAAGTDRARNDDRAREGVGGAAI